MKQDKLDMAMDTLEEVKEETMEYMEHEARPCPTDLEWSEYVLKQLTADEQYNGNPTVDGLRRLTELLIGPIVDYSVAVVQAPTKENQNRATVVVNLTLEGIDRLLRFAGAADSYDGNTDEVYRKYPVAIAETRAEGRALRKALKLRKVVSAEELSETAKEPDPVPLPNVEGFITQTQINFIDFMCRNDQRGLNLNVQKIVNKIYPDVHNIRELQHEQSLAVQKYLSELQQDKSKITEDVVGYNLDWKLDF